MTGLNSSADTPLDDVEWGEELFYFMHKKIISPLNCLLSVESQPNRLQLLQLEHVRMHFNLWLFLAVFVQLFTR